MTSDPVVAGLVKSLANPGGNITGVSTDVGYENLDKRLEILKEVAPGVTRTAFLLGLHGGFHGRKANPLYLRLFGAQAKHQGAEIAAIRPRDLVASPTRLARIARLKGLSPRIRCVFTRAFAFSDEVLRRTMPINQAPASRRRRTMNYRTVICVDKA
jgi:hypothetical protein